MYGLISVSTVGWVSGTFLGAAAGNILPAELSSAMGIVLYGMFLAIFIPAARESRGVFASVLIASGLSMIFKFVLTEVSGGFAVIICAVVSAAVCAVLFPKKDEEEAEE